MSDDKCPDGRECVYSRQGGQGDHLEKTGRAMCATCPERLKLEDSPAVSEPEKWRRLVPKDNS